MTVARDAAETLALEALAWLAGDGDLLGGFVAATGIAPGDLAGRAGDAAVLAAVLDFVLQSDDRVLGFARAAGVPPEDVAAAQAVLAGGPLPHWT